MRNLSKFIYFFSTLIFIEIIAILILLKTVPVVWAQNVPAECSYVCRSLLQSTLCQQCLANPPTQTQPMQCRSVNQPCDTQNPCCDGLNCTGRFCKTPISTPAPICGAVGQPCCTNNVCDQGLECMGRFCKVSGSVPQPPKNTEPVPGLLFPCDKTDDNEFHSLRPYQASPCGPYPKQALFCSNKLVIFENFKMDKECKGQRRKCENCDWDCSLSYQVEEHNLNITLDESELPIMGNTQDEFDDAQKVNEYASWYLSGVVDKRENENATDDQIVNFSGPVKKLLPSMIQDARRIEIINSTQQVSGKEPPPANPLEQDESAEILTDNHDQLVVDDKRLSFWLGDLSAIRSAVQSPLGQGVIGGLFGATGQLINQGLQSVGVNLVSEAWNMCRPPLPWDNGTKSIGVNATTGETETKPIPFASDLEYKKAYNEWLGKTCVILPVVGLQCIDIKIPTPLGGVDVISNECADLWHYVPLSNNSDSEGKNYLLTGDGPNYVPSQGTEIDGAQHKSFKNALLYFSHMQEVMGLSGLLNKTYSPQGYESEKLPETTEKIKKGIKDTVASPLPTTLSPDKQYPVNLDPYANLDCSAVNVRVNEGDDLFPGDRPSGKELFVEKVTYTITQAPCHEEYYYYWDKDEFGNDVRKLHDVLNCPAQVGIEFKTGTKTPLADEIFSQTVADSGSTFRKIFPKVEEGAPVECIADIPTTTNVTYKKDDGGLNQIPAGATQDFVQKSYPADGANSNTQLTFPHIGSVYEYFLKGIQTALRPKGYGEPIANGNCKTPAESVQCGDWENKLEQSGGECGICNAPMGNLAKRILATAGKAYNVPAANIWAAMRHEGGDWTDFDFSDENVRKWSNSEECGGEPMPSCDNTTQETQPPFGFLMNWFYNDAKSDSLWMSVQQIDPTRDSREKVSRCNFLDAAFAAANLLAQGSTAAANGILSCGGYTFDNSRPGTCSSSYWTPAHIVQSQTTYAGYCVTGPYYKAEDTVSWFNSAKCN